MPSAAVFETSPLAVEHLNDLPPFLHADPDIRAVIYCHAKEAERQEATLRALQRELNPLTATEVGLPWWETLLRLTVDPPGWTVQQRRDTVIAYLRKSRSSPHGQDWVANITDLVGPSWTYSEHDPDDPANSPAEYTVRVTLPWEPAAGEFIRTEALIRAKTPAHLDVELTYDTGGFPLDIGGLDVDALG